MVATVLRLKRRAEFLAVAAARRKWAAPGLILQARAHQDGESFAEDGLTLRVGFTVSRKVGKAVARNRARRRLRAAAQQVMAAEARPGFDYVVIGRAATLDRPFPLLIGDLRQALRRVGTLRPAATPETTELQP